MTTSSPHLGLIVPSTSDDFITADIATNWTTIDGSPGVKLTTSARSGIALGIGDKGMTIYETDTELFWYWNGTVFKRMFPKGQLGHTKYTSTVTHNFGSPTLSVGAVTCTVPAGGRDIKVTFAFNQYNATANSHLGFSIDGAGSGVDYNTLLSGAVVGGAGQGAGTLTWIYPAPAAGSHLFETFLVTTGAGYGQFLGARHIIVEEI